MDGRTTICLCPACRQRFSDTGCYRIRRAIFPQEIKEPCTYCQVRMGFDYNITPRMALRAAN